MARKAVSYEQFIEAVFPLRGIDVSSEVSEQRPLTTRVGKNVRANEPRTMRDRGGSRCGLSKFLPVKVSGDHKITHLNIIVDPTVDAIPSDPPGDGIEDPSTNNLSVRVPFGRLVRIGGSGRWYSRHTPLGIPAFRQAKSATFAQSSSPRSVTFDGFLIRDNLIVVFVAIQRGVNRVFSPTDPLAWIATDFEKWETGQLVISGPVVNAPLRPQLFPNHAGETGYDIAGWTLVTTEFDHIVTSTAPSGLLAPGAYRGGEYFDGPGGGDNSEFTPNLYSFTKVNRPNQFLFLSVGLPVLGATVEVTDDQGNTYEQKGGYVEDVTTGIRFAMFVARASNSVGNTISVQPKMGSDPYAVAMGIAACEYTGFSHAIASNTIYTNSGESTTPTTGAIPVTLSRSIAIACFCQASANLTFTPSLGFTTRTSTTHGEIGCAMYVVDKTNPPVGNTVVASGTLSASAKWLGIGKAFR